MAADYECVESQREREREPVYSPMQTRSSRSSLTVVGGTTLSRRKLGNCHFVLILYGEEMASKNDSQIVFSATVIPSRANTHPVHYHALIVHTHTQKPPSSAYNDDRDFFVTHKKEGKLDDSWNLIKKSRINLKKNGTETHFFPSSDFNL